MIYLVTKNTELFKVDEYKIISVEESLRIIEHWEMVQYDSETTGRDARLCTILCMQFGDLIGETQVVVDTTTVSPLLYKDVLESHFIIGQNLKFDLQFLFNYGIIPRNIYDTMIVEQVLYLGWPRGSISYSLKEIAWRRLKINIDKTVRGEIIWRGLDTSVILYAAGDVKYLGDIMKSQLEDCEKQDLMKAAKLECDAVPSIAYMEWCGIHLNQERWLSKMKQDKENLANAKAALDAFVTANPEWSRFTYINREGNLWTGYDLTPKCTINWSSSQQVVEFAKVLGFDTKMQDKKTGEDRDSVLEKHLKVQKGINDEFLALYFAYQEYNKVVTSFGQGHLDAINPVTDRIHTTYKQLGAASGRMSCGSQQPNTDLARYKNIKPSSCTFPNIQQLPHDELTRAAFTAPKGYKWVSCDFSSEESRLGADIYQDKAFLKEFIEGSGDTHSMFAWAVFKDECKACGCKSVADVKKLAKQWRQAVKAVEFAYMFGAAAPTISVAANCTVEQAQKYIDALDKEFVGMAEFAKRGSKFVRKNGYVLICKYTGHKLYWWDHKQWLERQKSFTPEFWEEYKLYHKGTNDEVAKMVRKHFQAAGKWDRMARNACTQGTGAVIMKSAMTSLFNWIVEHNYFGKVEIAATIHDEIDCIYPDQLEEFPKVLETIMEESAAKYCKSLPIPAEAEVADCWVH